MLTTGHCIPRRLHARQQVTVSKLDRLALSTRNLLEIVELIGAAGARFQSILQALGRRTTHAGKAVMTIFAGIAAFERYLFHDAPAPAAWTPRNAIELFSRYGWLRRNPQASLLTLS